MATTTNYSWTTPDDTALVKDGASAIRSLGTAIDTTTKNLNPSTTLGDIEYRSSTANTNTRLAIGSTGNVLTVAGGVPTWAAPAGGGKVLQVVSTSYSTETTNGTSTYADTGLTLSITPTLSTSKILVIVGQSTKMNGVTAGYAGSQTRLLRGSTSILADLTSLNQAGLNPSGQIGSTDYLGFTYLDSPATTSSTTYKTQGRTALQGSGHVSQYNSTPSTLTLMEIGA